MTHHSGPAGGLEAVCGLQAALLQASTALQDLVQQGSALAGGPLDVAEAWLALACALTHHAPTGSEAPQACLESIITDSAVSPLLACPPKGM